MGSRAESYASAQLLATTLFLFFVRVTPGSPSSVTAHSVSECAALISTILPIRAGFHASLTFARSPGLQRGRAVDSSFITPLSSLFLLRLLYGYTVFCQGQTSLSMTILTGCKKQPSSPTQIR
ncbi:hypothetical protein PhiBTCVTUL1a_15 [Burkholderia phage phiBtTUL1a]|nr:hypothetical protein PhiBTCVTUL1a_15 [Burkholderia phage phiBtTUL1a]